jgi:hypothetical protein
MKETEGIVKSKHLRRSEERASHPDNKVQQCFLLDKGDKEASLKATIYRDEIWTPKGKKHSKLSQDK